MMHTRRGFLGLALCTAGGACLSRTGTSGGGESYSVALLGDTHFDSTDTKYAAVFYGGSSTVPTRTFVLRG